MTPPVSPIPPAEDMVTMRTRMPRVVFDAIVKAAEAAKDDRDSFVIGRLKASLEWSDWQAAKKDRAA